MKISTGNIVIRNGNVFINPLDGFQKLDVQIENGFITHVSETLPNTVPNDEIDATNQFVVPGFIDIHCHLRDPGQTHKEDISSGSFSAATGGYTTIVAMANTNPVIDSLDAWRRVQNTIQTHSAIEVIQAGAISRNLKGQELSELFLSEAFPSNQPHTEHYPFVFSDDGMGLTNPQLFRKAMQVAKKENYLCILHEEEKNISTNGILHESQLTSSFGYPGIPSSSESVCVARDLLISHEENYSPHFTHLSSKQSMDILKSLSEESYHFSADTTPHHLYFSEKDIDPTNTNFKMNPPLRTEEDQKSLKEGIRKGVIQCIGTDHAPHASMEKNTDFQTAPFGIIGFETSFAACYTALVLQGWISFPHLIHLFTAGPSSILQLKEHGSIQPGYRGNITIVDDHEYVVPSTFHSKSTNSPFIGRRLQGRIRATIFRGKVIYSDKN
jgi:dihydroorotase